MARRGKGRSLSCAACTFDNPRKRQEAEPTAGCCAHHDRPASNVSARFDGLVAEKIDCLCAKRRESHTPPHTQISNGLWALKLWHLDRAIPPKWAVTLSFCRSILKAIFRPCVPFRARRMCVVSAATVVSSAQLLRSSHLRTMSGPRASLSANHQVADSFSSAAPLLCMPTLWQSLLDGMQCGPCSLDWSWARSCKACLSFSQDRVGQTTHCPVADDCC